jgi:phage shock protein PspC (stress-responsive transcriptional regulator)
MGSSPNSIVNLIAVVCTWATGQGKLAVYFVMATLLISA